MAIENNYGGPPSLEIYQEFVRSTGTTGADQNVVVVAQHYDVVKAADANMDQCFSYTYGEPATQTWADIKDHYEANGGATISEDNAVDTDSVAVVFKKAYVSQNKDAISFTVSESNSYELVLEHDVYDTNSYTELTTPVLNGDKVLLVNGSSYKLADIVSIKETNTQEMTGNGASLFDLEGAEDGVYYVMSNDGATVKVIPANTSCNPTATIKEGVTPVNGQMYVINVHSNGLSRIIHVDVDATGYNKVYFGKEATDLEVTMNSFVADDEKISVTNAKDLAGHPVLAGDFFVEFRAASKKYNGKLGYITHDNLSDVGYTGVENPLGAMVKVALKGGRAVYCTSVEADTVAAYRKAFVLLSRSTSAYAIVLGSLNRAVITEADAFVYNLAAPKVANYKILYYGMDDTNKVAILNEVHGIRPIANITADGVVTFIKDNATAGFYGCDVMAGDTFVTNYRVNSYGETISDEYEVVSVSADNTLKIKVGTGFKDMNSVSFEIHRELVGADLVDALKDRVYTTHHRSYCVFGDGISIDGIENAPAWLKAALPAGMRAGEYCQRPISNLVYSGCEANNKLRLDASQLRSLASRGVWILANDADGKTVYNYHQLSTDMSDKKYQEQSYTTNFDSISKQARALMVPYYGNSNISEDFLAQLLANLSALLGGFTVNAPSIEIGPQLIRYENLTLTQDTTNRDHVYMEVDYVMPAPFNHITMRQRLI